MLFGAFFGIKHKLTLKTVFGSENISLKSTIEEPFNKKNI